METQYKSARIKYTIFLEEKKKKKVTALDNQTALITDEINDLKLKISEIKKGCVILDET